MSFGGAGWDVRAGISGKKGTEMPGKRVPAWKAKAKSSDLSPKELLWQERQKDSNMQANAAARQVCAVDPAEQFARKLGEVGGNICRNHQTSARHAIEYPAGISLH